VWDNPERAQELGRERVALEKIVHIIDELDTSLADTSELLEMAGYNRVRRQRKSS
jgi:peptide chain release factor 2